MPPPGSRPGLDAHCDGLTIEDPAEQDTQHRRRPNAMAWSAARVMLLVSGALYLAMAIAGLSPLAIQGASRAMITIGAPLTALHATLGALTFAAGALSRKDHGARVASAWLIAANVVLAYWYVLAIYTIPLTPIDVVSPLFMAVLLFVGIRASRPTPPRAWERRALPR